MEFEAFELAVIDLAWRDVKLTVANVAAHTRLPPSRVEALLDRMAAEGRLDMELDEARGLIFYVVRGLTPPPPTLAVRPPEPRYAAARPTAGAKARTKSPLIGAIAGFVLPGVGLLYAAPLTAVAAVSVGMLVVVKMAGALPLIGWLMASVATGLGAVASGLLGAMYARKYNLAGRRVHLDLAATRSAGRTLVSPLREAQRVALS